MFKGGPRALIRFLPDWRIVLSAALIIFAFPTWNFSFLIWIALVPWFLALDRTRTWKQALLQGTWFGALVNFGSFYWVATVLQEFAQIPWAAAIFGLCVFALFNQLQFSLFSIFLFKLRGRLREDPRGARPLWIPVAIALLYTAFDWAIPKLFTDTLGHSQYNVPYTRQIADIGGAYLITFLIFFVNDWIYEFVRRFRVRNEPSYWPPLRALASQGALAFGLLAATVAYGAWRVAEVADLVSHSKRGAQFGVIQANIGDFDKVAAENGVRGAAHKVLETFFNLTDQALAMTPRPDYVIWPETSYPAVFRMPQTADELERDQSVDRFARERKIPLLFGGYDHEGMKDYNAFFFLNPYVDPGPSGRADVQVYRKSILLLFGEYIPLADQIEYLRKAFPTVGNFGRGAGPTILPLPAPPNTPGGPIRVSPIICYEGLFPNYVLEAARRGGGREPSEAIVNVTNDSWFGAAGEPWLHLALTTFRAVESRLPLLRSTNTGISTLIMADGELSQSSRIGEAQILNIRVPVTPYIWTLMKAWGSWFGPFAALVGALLLFWGMRRRPV